MTTEEIAKERFHELNLEVQKCKTFEEFVSNHECHNVCDEFADLNYREFCFTIQNENGKPVLSHQVEAYDEYGHFLYNFHIPFSIGDRVIWYDPEEDARDLSRIYTIFDIRDEIICISDGFSEAEVYESELEYSC